MPTRQCWLLSTATCVCCSQGFDKYGIGAYDGLPVPNLVKALGLKVCMPFCALTETEHLVAGFGTHLRFDLRCTSHIPAFEHQETPAQARCNGFTACSHEHAFDAGSQGGQPSAAVERLTTQRWPIPTFLRTPTPALIWPSLIRNCVVRPNSRGSMHNIAQSGIVSSGNSLDFTKEDLDLFETHGVAVKEMEAAAVAWAAHLHATPMFALKAITDIVDGAHPSAIAGPRAQAGCTPLLAVAWL